MLLVTLQQVAEAYYTSQAAINYAAVRAVRSYWARVSAADINRWRDALAPVAQVVAASQVVAAQDAEGYVAAALGEQVRRPGEPLARVDVAGFAGMPNGDAPVAVLLDQPRVAALSDIAQGLAPRDALARGRWVLERNVLSLVQDAGRQAVGAGMVAHPRAQGWMRMINPPSCADCVILAGKWFRYNQGFLRHPSCDCRHVPMAETGTAWEGPERNVQQLVESGRVTGLSEAEREAILDGADPVQVVNARRGRSADKMYTTEGTTRRGVASRTLRERRGNVRETARTVGPRGAVRNYTERRVIRPTPEGIYQYAADRDEALKLLRDFGYIR